MNTFFFSQTWLINLPCRVNRTTTEIWTVLLLSLLVIRLYGWPWVYLCALKPSTVHLFTQCFGTLYPIFPKRNKACLIIRTLYLYISKYVDLCCFIWSFSQITLGRYCRYSPCFTDKETDKEMPSDLSKVIWWGMEWEKRKEHWTSRQEVVSCPSSTVTSCDLSQS